MTIATTATYPLSMQYLGSKHRIASWIGDVLVEALPDRAGFIDVMAGTGAMTHEAHSRGWTIAANDIQPYSHAVLTSAFATERLGAQIAYEALSSPRWTNLLSRGARGRFADLAAEEAKMLEGVIVGELSDHDYRTFCDSNFPDASTSTGEYDLFISYYANTYFGLRQCMEIDALRELADDLGGSAKAHIIGALVSAMTHTASTTTHLAQYLKPRSPNAAKELAMRRQRSIKEAVVTRLMLLSSYPIPSNAKVTHGDFVRAIDEADFAAGEAIVYADPPYFKEHYSRYYHLLDTAVLYDYPSLTFNPRLGKPTVGRYRENRIVSDFGLRSKAPRAFARLFEHSRARGFAIALSYANTSIVHARDIKELASDAGFAVSIHEKNLSHSGQGLAGTRTDVTELLFVMRPV